jgi:hypothetical protein
MYNTASLEEAVPVNPERSIGVLLAVTAFSSVAMLWLLWRYPLLTGIFALMALGAMFLLARVARGLDMSKSSASTSTAADRGLREFGLSPRAKSRTTAY